MERKRNSPIPFDFVVEKLYSVDPVIKPMFGCFAIYVRNKMVAMLRLKDTHTNDNGVWFAVSPLHRETLKKEFPGMRSVSLLGKKETVWQNIHPDLDDFEESVLNLCDRIIKGDPCIGKETGKKKPKRS